MPLEDKRLHAKLLIGALMTTVSASSWLNRIDSNNRRCLAPSVAVGVGVLTKIARESKLPGPWQTISSFVYALNILLIPSSAEKLTDRITHLKSKHSWHVVSKLRHIRALFQSSLSFLVSTTFTAFGLNEACQLTGHAVKPFELGLNAILPWVKAACRVTAIFQLYDIVHGVEFRRELRQTLTTKKINSTNWIVFCTNILSIVKKHHCYYRSWERQPSLSVLKKAGQGNYQGKDFSQLTEEVTETVHSLLRHSDRHIRYQFIGLLGNILNIGAMVITNSLGLSILLLGACTANIARETWKNNL